MLKYFYIGILFLKLSSTVAFLVPDGYEIKYTYESNVKVDSSSEDLTSQYDILAEIAIKNQNNGYLVSFDNFKYSEHAGSTNDNDKIVLKSPEDMKNILELPILIVNVKDHYVMKFQKNDILRSIKLKTAIANLLNKKEIDQNYSRNIFEENNDTIKFRYALRSKAENDKNEIITLNDFSLNQKIDLCQKVGTDTNIIPNIGCKAQSYVCDVHEEFYTVQDSKGIYVSEITSSSVKKMPSEEYFTTTSQRVRMVSISKTEKSEVNNEYVTIDEIESDFPTDVNQLKLKVKTILENLSEYFDIKRIDLSKPLVDQDYNFINLINHLKKLGEKEFLQIFDDLLNVTKDDRAQEMFSYVLPYVGTKEAIKATCYLIKNKLVGEIQAIGMLQNIFRLKISNTSNYVNELEELTEKEAGLSDRVRWTATLAFAATLNNFGKIATNSPKDDFDEYINKYSKRLLNVEGYKEKFLSVNALSNIQIGKVSPIMENIIGGKGSFVDLDPHLRSLSMLSSLQYTRQIINNDGGKKIEDTYMPIFLNKAENVEVRLMALYVLMKTNDPKIWIKLFVQMDKEEANIRCLYHVFLKSIVESDAGCYKNNEDIANVLWKKSFEFIGKEILKNMNQLQDMIDPLKNVGYFMNYINFGNINKDRFVTMFLDRSFSVKNTIFDDITYYVHIRATNDSEQFDDDFMNMFQSQNLRIELLGMKHNVVVFAGVYGSLLELFLASEYGNFLMKPEKVRYLQISSHQTDFDNDLGMPVKMYFDHSNVYELKSLKTLKFSVQENSLELSYKDRENMEYGIKIFNPITNKWHGIRRVQSIDRLFGIEINHKTDFITSKTTVDINPFTENKENVGFKSIGQTEAFIIDEEITDQNCEECIIHVPMQTSKNLTIWENDDTGLLYQLKLFDCDEEVIKKYKTHIKRLIVAKFKKFNILSISNTLYSLIDYITLFAGSGTCGIGYSVEPSEKYPMTHFRFGISHDPTKNNGLLISKMNESKTIQSWNIEMRNSSGNNVELEMKQFSDENEIVKKTCVNIKRDISKISSLKEIKVFNGDCYQNESIFSMKSEGKKTNEHDPTLENTIYKKCMSNPMYLHIVCATEATAFRDYTIQIDYKSLPIISKLIQIFERSSNTNESGHLLFQLHYPANESEVVDIVCKDPPDGFGEVRMNLDYSKWPYWTLPHSAFGYRSMIFRENECEITMNQTTSLFKKDHNYSLNDTWKILLSDCDDSICNWKILAKRVSDVQETMAIRIEIENSTMVFYKDDEIHVETGMYVPEQNGSFITMGPIEYKLLDDGKVALIFMKDRNILIGYDGVKAQISVPFMKNFSVGDLCST